MQDQEQLVQLVKESLRKRGCITLKAKSGTLSMRPLILDDTLLFIEEINGINKGDLLLLNFYTEFCCHRVIDIKENYVLTKGDNNSIVDYPVCYNQILGKVVGLTRDSKKYNLKKGNAVLGKCIAFFSKLAAEGQPFKKINSKIELVLINILIMLTANV